MNWVLATMSNFIIPISFQPLIFQTWTNWFNRIHSLKYLRYATLGCEDIAIRKPEFEAKTHVFFFSLYLKSKLERPRGHLFEIKSVFV